MIVLARASCAAMPFRSVPDEAAVAEVLGTLPVVGGGDPHPVEVDPELLGDDLRDLGVEPLPHLGAAVVQMHDAVGVDVHQRAGLVEVRGGERDAELDRREREPALDAPAAGVEVADRAPPARAVVGAGLELVDDAAR